MEINENVKSFLKEAGILTAFENVVANSENEEFDALAEAKKYKDTQEKLFENKNKDRLISKEDQDKKFAIVRGTLSQTANKFFELGLPRKEAEAMTLEDILEKAREKHNTEKESLKNESNEELINKIKTLQTNNANLAAEKESLIEAHQAELLEKEQDYNSKLTTRDVRDLYQKEYAKYDWGIENKALIPVIKEAIEKKISEKYNVASDGTLTGKDSTHAESFDGNGIYENLSQPIAHLLKEEYQAVKLSASGGDGDGGKIVNGISVKDKTGQEKAVKLSEGAADMKARILAKMNKQQGGTI